MIQDSVHYFPRNYLIICNNDINTSRFILQFSETITIIIIINTIMIIIIIIITVILIVPKVVTKFQISNRGSYKKN